MPRINIIAGNWKMNKTPREGVSLTKAILKKAQPSKNTLVILGAPYTALQGVKEVIKRSKKIKLAAQNCHESESGAFTGEISAGMLASMGVDYVILGHSERRAIYGEDNKLIAKKVDAVIKHDMLPIFCCGEPLEVRKKKGHVRLIGQQLKAGLFHLSKKDIKKVVIAYEPVWAIGTGVTATPEQAQEMHGKIRAMVAKKYGPTIANNITILYGGSVKPGNAKELFSNPDVDGGLVGGASLKSGDFLKIISSMD